MLWWPAGLFFVLGAICSCSWSQRYGFYKKNHNEDMRQEFVLARKLAIICFILGGALVSIHYFV